MPDNEQKQQVFARLNQYGGFVYQNGGWKWMPLPTPPNGGV